MDRLIYVAMTGAKQLMHRQDNIAHNLANASTPGFRAETLAFRSAESAQDSRVYALESATGADYTPGPVQQTGRALDVAVHGKSWLAVQSRDGSEAYTRNGSLQVSAEGVLQGAGGLPVLGDGGPIAVPAGSEISIAADGTVSARPIGQARAATLTLGRLKLVTPEERELQRGGDGLFRARGGDSLAADPNARLASGSLEGSNVNTVDAVVSMIGAARQFEMQMKMLRTAEANAGAATRLLNVGG